MDNEENFVDYDKIDEYNKVKIHIANDVDSIDLSYGELSDDDIDEINTVYFHENTETDN